MASLGSSQAIVRLNFSKIEKIIDIPNLIDVQRKSYESFLQKEVPPEERQETGLQAVFKSVFPIRDFNETASLEFVSYSLGEPKYEVDECRQRGMTYAAPLKVIVRLINYEVDEEERKARPRVRDIKEQEVYFGEIPLMTDKGTFIVNPASSSSTRKGGPIRANPCIRPGSSPTGDLGWIWSSTPRVCSMYGSTGDGSFRSPFFCVLWGIQPKTC